MSDYPSQFRRGPMRPPSAIARQRTTSTLVRPILQNQPDFRGGNDMANLHRATATLAIDTGERYEEEIRYGETDSEEDEVQGEIAFIEHQRGIIASRLLSAQEDLADTLNVVSSELTNVYNIRCRITTLEYNIWMLNVQLGHVDVSDLVGMYEE